MRFLTLRGLSAVSGGLLLLLGGACDRSDSSGDTPRSGAGSVSGAPVSGRVQNSGVLQELSSYTPARVEGAKPAEGSSSETAANGGGGDDGAARALVKDTLNALRALNVDGLLAAFDETQIAAILPHKSLIIETIEKAEGLFRQLSEKSGADGSAQMKELNERFGEPLVEALAAAVVMQPLAPDVATLGIDPAKLEAGIAPLLPDLIETVKKMAAGQPGADPNQIAASLSPESLKQGIAMLPPLALPVKKSGDAWKIALPRAISEAEAGLFRDSLEFGKEFLDKFGAKITAAEKIDESTAQMAAMMVMGEMSEKLLALQQKFQEVTGAAESDAKKDAEAAPSPNQAPEEGQPEPDEGGKRSRRQAPGGP